MGIRSRKPQDPLQPISGILRLLFGLVLAGVVLTLLFPQQFYRGPVCSSSQSVTDFPGDPSKPYPKLNNTVPIGAKVSSSYVERSDLIQVCTDHPSAWLRAVSDIRGVPEIILVLFGLLLGQRVIETAAEPGGLYSAETARRVRTLGRFLVVGAIFNWVVTSAAQVTIAWVQVHGMGYIPTGTLGTVPFGSLVLGCVMLTLARVMRVGVAMREELDATV